MRRARIRRPRAWGSGSREWDPSLAPVLYEELPVGVIAAGRDGENLVFNRRARELFEGRAEDLDPGDCADRYGLYTAEGDRLLRTEEIPLQRALRGERLTDVVLTVQPRRGPRRTVSVSGGPVAGRGGRPVGAVVVIDDITDRLALEDELRFQSAIAEHMAEAVILIRAEDGEILYVNETAGSMFGYRRDELLGEPIAKLNVPTDEPPAARAAEIIDRLEHETTASSRGGRSPGRSRGIAPRPASSPSAARSCTWRRRRPSCAGPTAGRPAAS